MDKNKLNESTATLKPDKPDSKGSIPLLTIIQLIFFLIIVLAAYGIKTFGGNMYKQLSTWYNDNLNNEIILTDSFNDFSLDFLNENKNQGNKH